MFRHVQTCSDTIKFDLKYRTKKLITRNPTNMWSEILTKTCTMHAENCLEKIRQSCFAKTRPAEKCLEETGQTCKL
jgi:hypothetical protein